MEALDKTNYTSPIEHLVGEHPNSQIGLAVTASKEGLNPLYTTLLRAIIDLDIEGGFTTLPIVQKMVLIEVAAYLRTLKVKDKAYRGYINEVLALGLQASEGKKVVIETNIATFDYGIAFKALEKLSGTKLRASGVSVGELPLYRLRSFSVRFKNNYIYPLLDECFSGLASLMKKHKLELYVSHDFNLAVEARFWEIEELTDLLSKVRCFDRYKLKPDLTLYILPLNKD